MKLLDILQNFAFGVEFELCVHVRDKNFSTSDEVHKYLVKYFNNKPVCKQIGVKWSHYYVEDDPKLDYRNWTIMADMSVGCPDAEEANDAELKGKYCVIKGRYTDCPPIQFFQEEIITEVLYMKDFSGLRKLKAVWFNCIMSDNLTYLINSTQGFHIHLSNPNLDLYKFLKLWYVYEPVIKNILPPERRVALVEFAKDVRLMCSLGQLKDRQLPKLSNPKYYAVNTSHFKPDSCRLEIRVYPGTADFTEILNWILFCLLFASSSILLDDRVIDKLAEEIVYDTFETKKRSILSLFQNCIHDSAVSNYFIAKYNKNKEFGWPEINRIANNRIVPVI